MQYTRETAIARLLKSYQTYYNITLFAQMEQNNMSDMS